MTKMTKISFCNLVKFKQLIGQKQLEIMFQFISNYFRAKYIFLKFSNIFWYVFRHFTWRIFCHFCHLYFLEENPSNENNSCLPQQSNNWYFRELLRLDQKRVIYRKNFLVFKVYKYQNISGKQICLRWMHNTSTGFHT